MTRRAPIASSAGRRQSAGTGADLDDRGSFQRARGARDPSGEVEASRKF